MTLPKYLGIAKLRTLKNGNLEIVFKRNNQIFLTQPFYHLQLEVKVMLYEFVIKLLLSLSFRYYEQGKQAFEYRSTFLHRNTATVNLLLSSDITATSCMCPAKVYS